MFGQCRLQNTIGSFECTCSPGYFGDGVSCVGACEANEDQCSDNADCTDNGADYSCACLPGFEGDGFTCTDINECARGIAECAPNAGCVNTEGSFECVCHEGFVGDGSVCACESGYREIAGTCADINECDLGTDTCLDTELCLNTDGSFQCIGPGAPGEPEPGEPEEPGELVCPDGFVLIGNIVVPGATGLAAASMPGIEFDNDTYSSASNNDTLADAQLITNRSTLRGQVDHSIDELDIFRVTLERGQEISLLIDSGNTNIDLDLHLYHLDGTPVLNPDGTPIRSIGKSSLETLTAGRAGDFLVAVQAAKGASSYSLVIGGQLGRNIVAAIPPKFIPGEVIVTFNPKFVHQKSTIQSAAQTMGMHHTRANLGRASLMRSNPQITAASTSATDYSGLKPAKDALAMAKLWEARSDVLSATPNYLYQASSVPNDEHYPKQWHYPAINLPQAWDHVPDASSTIVAVIDTGVILSHPDLNDNLVAGFDFISDPNRARDGDGIDSNPDDVGDSANPGQSSYHGTHVAGTVSAESNNGIGGAGVAQGARIMPLRVLGAGGGSSYDIMQAIRFAAGLPNDSNTVPSQIADVINLSLGGSGFSPNFQNLIADVRAQGVIIVAAAGNDSSSQLFYPASYDGVISVSATNFENGLSYFSNYGGAIDVAAPGGDMRVDKNGDGLGDGIYSTLGSDTSGTIQPSYANYQGTSMASPHVAGVVALMRAANSDLTPQDIDNLLAAGTITTDLGPPGRDNSFGHGLINAEAAVIRARDHVPGAPPELNPVLVSDPPSLSFLDPQITSEILTLSNGGGGTLAIDNPIPSETWILVELIDTIGGESRYTITVDRSELAVGSYSATLSVTSSANSIQIPVVMQIAAPQCVDIDECEEDIDGCAIPSENGDCRNLPGSFECYCLDGYDGDGVTCQDIDECAEGIDDCSDNAECTNTDPGFSCECLPGFTGDGVECLPPNECDLGTDDCDENATCSDTEEGFDCSCNTGYSGDGTVCEDIDECAEGSHDCDANAVCENDDGSFTCECSPHFSGDGKTCAIDEGCVSLENFEGTWPNSQWQSPWGNTLDGDLTANAARTGSLGLSTLSERALYSTVQLGQEGDKLGIWLRLDDVGSTASLSFASSVAGGYDLRVDAAVASASSRGSEVVR
ncbi:MAG: S8 family serine peptidase [Kofleriaceae bacterium]|nr:S8 family serine peptidase [Kofleriaceae bacterium]